MIKNHLLYFIVVVLFLMNPVISVEALEVSDTSIIFVSVYYSDSHSDPDIQKEDITLSNIILILKILSGMSIGETILFADKTEKTGLNDIIYYMKKLSEKQ